MKQSILAKGGTSGGEGGFIRINNARAPGGVGRPPLNINGSMSVDATYLGNGNESLLAGKISINEVTCQQWQNSGGTWPKTFWDCATPASPNLEEKSVVSAAQSVGCSQRCSVGVGVGL